MADSLLRESDDAFLARIRPELEKIEIIRLGKYDNCMARQRSAVGLGLLVVVFAVLLDVFLAPYMDTGDQHVVVLVLAGLAGWGILYWTEQPARDYVTEYKIYVLPQVARLLGLGLYLPYGRIPEAEVNFTGIVPAHSKYISEDYFEGVYKNARLRFASVRFEKEEGGEKEREAVTVFEGVAISLVLPKNKFSGRTILMKNRDRVSEWMESALTDLARADLVDPVFEKQYSVFTDDQVGARALLDPAMMERIMRISTVFASSGFSMSCAGSSVFALLNTTRRLFEPGDVSLPATDPVDILNIKRDIEQVLDLIDYLGV